LGPLAFAREVSSVALSHFQQKTTTLASTVFFHKRIRRPSLARIDETKRRTETGFERNRET
jgi:hypothetical protein